MLYASMIWFDQMVPYELKLTVGGSSAFIFTELNFLWRHIYLLLTAGKLEHRRFRVATFECSSYGYSFKTKRSIVVEFKVHHKTQCSNF